MADGYLGSQDHGTAGSEFGATDFIVRRIAGRMATTSLVQVRAVRPGADLAHGFVDVQPMVGQLDGAGVVHSHGVIQNVPYLRLQGGANAIVIDPAVGDIGLATFAAEDISRVKETLTPGGPGSRRRFSMGDALYHGGLLNQAPTQYIQFADDGIVITSADGKPVTINAPGGCTVTAPTVTFDADSASFSGDLAVTGKTTLADLTATGAVSLDDATINGKDFANHHHSGVTTGTGTSGPPS